MRPLLFLVGVLSLCALQAGASSCYFTKAPMDEECIFFGTPSGTTGTATRFLQSPGSIVTQIDLFTDCADNSENIVSIRAAFVNGQLSQEVPDVSQSCKQPPKSGSVVGGFLIDESFGIRAQTVSNTLAYFGFKHKPTSLLVDAGRLSANAQVLRPATSKKPFRGPGRAIRMIVTVSCTTPDGPALCGLGLVVSKQVESLEAVDVHFEQDINDLMPKPGQREISRVFENLSPVPQQTEFAVELLSGSRSCTSTTVGISFGMSFTGMIPLAPGVTLNLGFSMSMNIGIDKSSCTSDSGLTTMTFPVDVGPANRCTLIATQVTRSAVDVMYSGRIVTKFKGGGQFEDELSGLAKLDLLLDTSVSISCEDYLFKKRDSAKPFYDVVNFCYYDPAEVTTA